MTGAGIRQTVTDDDRSWWRVEVSFDVIEPQDPAIGRHIQRAVVNGDTIRLIETAGDHHDTISLVVAVAIDDRVYLAGEHRSDEHRAPRSERQLARIRHAVGEDGDVEARRNYPLRRLGVHKSIRRHDGA